MILYSLYQLYDRLEQEPAYSLPRYGFSLQNIVFVVVLQKDGALFAIQDVRIADKNGRLRPRQLLVPGNANRSGSGFRPLFLWDKTEYVLGFKVNDPNPNRTAGAFQSFRTLHLNQRYAIQSPAYLAVCNFLEQWDPVEANNWEVLQNLGPGYGVFQILGETSYVHEDPEVQNWWLKNQNIGEAVEEGHCLVTGEIAPLARLQTKIKKVGSAGEAQLVSFNKDAFESYGKKQSLNAPISEGATFRYATALNSLLAGPMSFKHRFSLGDATVVFWTDRPSFTEDIFAAFAKGQMTYASPTEAQDEETLQNLQLFLGALRRGREAYSTLDKAPDQTKFNLLALTAPSPGRLSVRFFYQDRLSKLLDNLKAHIDDIAMVPQYSAPPQGPGSHVPSVQQILNETDSQVKSKQVHQKNYHILEAPLLRAILEKRPYPIGLILAIIRRIHADRKVNYVRACIIAGYLRRNLNKEVDMGLDPQRSEPAYLLGRLFAVLEKVQREALPEIKATIRERFYSSASATPAVAFPILLRTYQHHLAKLNPGLKIIRERLVQEILASVTEFPAHLALVGQGLFALGYYHQTKDLWTAKGTTAMQKEERDESN